MIAIDLVLGLLLAGKCGDADAARVGGVEALDEGAGSLCVLCTWLTALEELREAHVSFATNAIGELLQKCEGGVVLGKTGEDTMHVANIHALARLKGGAGIVEDTEQLGRAAMDKLGAVFDGRGAVIRMQSEDAPTDAIAGFEEGDGATGGGELSGSG